MAEITAVAVKALRDKTGLPMMECKKALVDADGDQELAVTKLRESGAKTMAKRADRQTSFGRFGIYTSIAPGAGAMVELKCESAPVTQNEDFIQLANDLAEQLATKSDITTADELLDQTSPTQTEKTLREVKDDLFNRIREVFNIGRMIRIDGPCGGYSHNATTVSGAIMHIEGGNAEAAKDICMHIAALSPKALHTEELDQELVAKERSILTEQARQEGKPDNIIEKMVEGRMRNFYAQHVLTEQSFVKDDSVTVGKFASSQNMTLKKFVHWVLGDDNQPEEA
ncbi:MAG TPA: translation elongation factor Ts [Nitrospirales bacterium]|nr:translation elongation factor Ts [Nitrospirales bacterium]